MSYSVEDLWNWPAEHGCYWLPPNSAIPEADRIRYIPAKQRQFIPDYFDGFPFEWDEDKLRNGFAIYRRISALNIARSPYLLKYDPPKGSLNNFRYWLHIKLLRWGVII